LGEIIQALRTNHSLPLEPQSHDELPCFVLAVFSEIMNHHLYKTIYVYEILKSSLFKLITFVVKISKIKEWTS